ncbi:MAG: hypothetical protein ACHQTE_01175 [Candidatus Saccharimonadales bacterium]
MSELVRYRQGDSYEIAKAAALDGLQLVDGKYVSKTTLQPKQPLQNNEKQPHFKRNASIAVIASLAVGGYMGVVGGDAFISNRSFLEAANPAVIVNDTMNRVHDLQHGVDVVQNVMHFFGGK